MSPLAPALALLATLWPAVLAVAFVDHRDRHPSWISVGAYLAAGRVCHQRPDRSFTIGGYQWPVCGRCAGLYLGAPVGAWGAWLWGRRRRAESGRAGDARSVHGATVTRLAIASVPTIATVAAEFLWPASVQSWHRFVAAVPLGVVLAVVVTSTARGWRQIGAIH